MPSHQTIKTFMDRYLVARIEDSFYDLSKYIIKKEKIDTQKSYIDGTKIESVANKYTFTWRNSVVKFRDKLYQKYGMYSKDTHDKKPMKDSSFTLNLIKKQESYIAPNGDELTFFYRLPNGKHKEINDENLTYQKEVIRILKSSSGIDLRIQRSI